jgi:hypothetical protein
MRLSPRPAPRMAIHVVALLLAWVAAQPAYAQAITPPASEHELPEAAPASTRPSPVGQATDSQLADSSGGRPSGSALQLRAPGDLELARRPLRDPRVKLALGVVLSSVSLFFVGVGVSMATTSPPLADADDPETKSWRTGGRRMAGIFTPLAVLGLCITGYQGYRIRQIKTARRNVGLASAGVMLDHGEATIALSGRF